VATVRKADMEERQLVTVVRCKRIDTSVLTDPVNTVFLLPIIWAMGVTILPAQMIKPPASGPTTEILKPSGFPNMDLDEISSGSLKYMY
jgi:hypothetical protein